MKYIIPLLLLCFSILPDSLFSQSKPNYVGQWYQQKAQGKKAEKADAFTRMVSDFSRTKKYNLRANLNRLNSVMNTKPEILTLTIPYGNKNYTLNLAKVDVAAPEFSVKTNNGSVPHDKGVQYRGIVNNNPAHIATLNLTRSDQTAFFSTDEGNFVVTKDGVDFVAYNTQELMMPQTFFCQTPEVTEPVIINRSIVTDVGCKTVKVYFECDYAFFQSKGSNVATLTDYVMGFFNQVATLYANEDINIQVSEVFAWTTPDPYTALTTPSAIMNQFKTTRGTNYNGNLAHFLTTRNVGGGMAYVDVICNKAFAYGVSRIYTTYSNFPTYSWTVNVVAHELGHNLGSPHTHSCTWPGGPIDNCLPQEGTCSPGPAPINGGTIMSYCHTTSVGINFNNGFGLLPGNLIRSKVAAATCLPAGTSTAPPTSLSATNITTNSATLNWVAVPGGGNYTVQYKLATATIWTSGGSTTATNLNITGLASNSAYQWSVKSDCSAFATTAAFTTLTGISSCAAPTQLASSAITQTGAALSWAAVSGASGYTVQYKTSTATTWTSVNATTNTHVLSGLTAGTTYNWQVKASCSTGYSAQSSFVTASTTGCPAPTQLSSSGISQTSATVSWAAVGGATGYTLQYKTSTATTWTSVSVSTTSRALSGLVAGTAYVWQVKASCSTGYSSQGSFTTASSTGTGCTVPSNLSATSITTNTATLNWTGPSNAVSYTIRYKPLGFSGWTYRSNVTGNSLRITNLLSKKNYQWVINVKCSNGTTSSYSGTKQFTTL